MNHSAIQAHLTTKPTIHNHESAHDMSISNPLTYSRVRKPLTSSLDKNDSGERGSNKVGKTAGAKTEATAKKQGAEAKKEKKKKKKKWSW